MPCSSLFCHRKEVILSTQLCLLARFSSCRLSRYFSILCQGLIIKMTIRQTSLTGWNLISFISKESRKQTKKVHPGRVTGCPHFVLASPTAGRSKRSSSCYHYRPSSLLLIAGQWFHFCRLFDLQAAWMNPCLPPGFLALVIGSAGRLWLCPWT